MVDGINNSSYIQRMQYNSQYRQQTGIHGDIRDNAKYTVSGRQGIINNYWHQMGGYGDFGDAAMMAKMQKEANTQVANQSAWGNIVGAVKSGVEFFKGLFG